jgi:uncharacterized membrane protein (UPF0136 family)
MGYSLAGAAAHPVFQDCRRLGLNYAALAFPAVILVSITGLLLLISQDWRVSILLLALQYAGIFSLVALSWPPEMAAVKLVTGWMSGAVLGMAFASAPEKGWKEGEFPLSHLLFRLILAGLMILVVISAGPQMAAWLPEAERLQLIGGALLIGAGLLQLGLSNQPVRVVVGLLTVLGGFEVFYAIVERSTLVAGLLAGINLGLALVGAYLLTLPGLPEVD